MVILSGKIMKKAVATKSDSRSINKQIKITTIFLSAETNIRQRFNGITRT